MQQPDKSLKFSLDSILVIGFMLASMIPYFYRKGHGDVVAFCLFFLWLVTVAFRKTSILMLLRTLALRKFELWLLFLFHLVTLYNYFFVSTTTKAFQFILMPVMYCFIIILDAYYFNRNPQYKVSIFFVVILVLGIQAIISLPYIFTSDEMVSRMYTGGELDDAALDEALKHGVGGVSLYANLCGMFFFGIGMLNKFSGKHRILVLISLCLILVSIVSSSYSLSLFLLLTGSIIFLVRANWRNFKISYVVFIVLVCIGLFAFYNAFLAESDIIEPIQRKINLIRTGNLKEDGRIDLALISLNTFLNNPFFGIGVPGWGLEKEIGEHAPWIDFPAHYGFIGFLPFVLFLILLFKRNVSFYFKSPRQNIYATACLIGFSIFFVSNFIDPLLFENPIITMLIFFYASMFNWDRKPLRSETSFNEKHSLHQRFK